MCKLYGMSITKKSTNTSNGTNHDREKKIHKAAANRHDEDDSDDNDRKNGMRKHLPMSKKNATEQFRVKLRFHAFFMLSFYLRYYFCFRGVHFCVCCVVYFSLLLSFSVRMLLFLLLRLIVNRIQFYEGHKMSSNVCVCLCI